MTERLHPFTLLLTIVPMSVVVVMWLNLYSAAFVLLTWLLLSALLGVWRELWRPTTLAIVIAALTAAASMALYGRSSGQVWFAFGPAVVSDGSLEIAAATALRILAVALPAALVVRTIELTRFADALEQTARLPARAVWGSFAGFRQIELARSDWEVVRMARRARGAQSGTRLQRLGSSMFAVFALAMERGGDLAVTMDSRGLNLRSRVPSRTIRWHRRDVLVMCLGAFIGIGAAAVAVCTGGSVVGAG